MFVAEGGRFKSRHVKKKKIFFLFILNLIMVVTQEKLQIIVIHPYPRNLAFILFMFKTIRGVV